MSFLKRLCPCFYTNEHVNTGNEINTLYSSPLPHVLILTAIVVGISTTALGLAIIIRIHSAFGTIDDDVLKKEME